MIEFIPGKTLQDYEDQAIIAALRFHKGNRTETAQALGIARRSLWRKIIKLKEKGFEVPSPKSDK